MSEAVSSSPLPAAGPVQMTGRTPSDHIVVFDGNPRLAGATLDVDIDDATSFTLFGRVVTGEQVGVVNDCCDLPAMTSPRIELPLVS